MRYRPILLALLVCSTHSAAQSTTTLVDEARKHLNEGRLVEAVRTFEVAVGRDSTNVPALRGLAAALHRLERYDEALRALDRAVALSPGDFAVRFNRGLTLSELGRISEAVTELEASVRLRSDFAPGWTELGAAKALLGRVPEARVDWDRAATVDSTYIWTRYYRALADITEGNYRTAVADLDAVTAREHLLSAHLWRWVAYQLDGRSAPSLVSSDTEWPAPIAQYLSGELSDSELVASATRERVRDDRRLAASHFFIGARRLAEGDRAGARVAFSRAIAQKAPRHAEVVAAAALLSRLTTGSGT